MIPIRPAALAGVSLLILAGAAQSACAQGGGGGALRFQPHPGQALRYKVHETTVDVDLPRKGAPVSHSYEVDKEVWVRQETGPGKMLTVRSVVRWARSTIDGKPLAGALAGPESVSQIDARGVPAQTPTTAIVPTPLILPQDPLLPPVKTLGQTAVPRVDWIYISPRLPALGVPLTVRYWTQGPRVFLGRECVIVRGVSEAAGPLPVDRFGVQLRGRLTAAFDAGQGVTVRATSENRVSWIWPLSDRGPHKRISRVTRMTSELLGVTAWSDAAPDSAVKPANSAPSGTGHPSSP